jgi:hypothetical protein
VQKATWGPGHGGGPERERVNGVDGSPRIQNPSGERLPSSRTGLMYALVSGAGSRWDRGGLRIGELRVLPERADFRGAPGRRAVAAIPGGCPPAPFGYA